jgi:hypothetical protein
MLAPVYRNVDAKNTLLGLSFPTEVLIVLAVWWTTMLALAPSTSAIVTLASYVAIRAVGYGRAPAFVQHWIGYQIRRALTGGRIAAGARSRTPEFPFRKARRSWWR